MRSAERSPHVLGGIIASTFLSDRSFFTRSILGIALSAIFGVLSLIHIYWALGGKAGREHAVPSSGGVPTIRPSATATFAVAAALAIAVLVILGGIGWFGDAIPPVTYAWMTLVIALLFLLRAIGDFAAVGFFKKPSDSSFAFWDTWLYSPLCVLITVLAFAILWLRP